MEDPGNQHCVIQCIMPVQAHRINSIILHEKIGIENIIQIGMKEGEQSFCIKNAYTWKSESMTSAFLNKERTVKFVTRLGNPNSLPCLAQKASEHLWEFRGTTNAFISNPRHALDHLRNRCFWIYETSKCRRWIDDTTFDGNCTKLNNSLDVKIEAGCFKVKNPEGSARYI